MLTRIYLYVIMQVLSKFTLHTRGAIMDIATKVELSALYEVYGNSLTDNQRQVIDFCVLQDLSLGEVSDLLNISRQAVKYTLDNATTSMLKLESKLQVLAKRQNLQQQLIELQNSTKDIDIKQKISDILEEL